MLTLTVPGADDPPQVHFGGAAHCTPKDEWHAIGIRFEPAEQYRSLDAFNAIARRAA